MSKAKTEKIRCIIVDDNRKILHQLEELFAFSHEVLVMKSFNSAKKFIKYLDSAENVNLPDIVITDINMPEISGIEMVLVAKARFPEMKFIMLSIHDDENFLFDAIKAGASGYLLKDDSMETIIKQIKRLHFDDIIPMSPVIAMKAFKLLYQVDAPKDRENNLKQQLSDREVDVLKLLIEALSYEQISDRLFISRNTVKKHISNIYRKMHVTSRAQAIKVARFHGLG